jgi:multiple sugar transport system ATP-binding protein
MIFQNLALYPDKTAYENLAFPLKQAKVDSETIDKKVREVAKQLKIDWLLEKIPSNLSGGERQRVAIGRAIVRQPQAYLMDEPLSNLDAILRLEMRVSLKELQTNLKETFVYVTHDQVEALSMGDRIGVLNHGVIQQVDTPENIYRNPNNMFVATILGNPPMNFLTCTMKCVGESRKIVHPAFSISADKCDPIKGCVDDNQALILGIRPEDIAIHLEKPKETSIHSQVYVTEPLGNETIVDVKVGEHIIKVIAEADFAGDTNQEIWLTLNESKLHLFYEDSGECFCHATIDDRFLLV